MVPYAQIMFARIQRNYFGGEWTIPIDRQGARNKRTKTLILFSVALRLFCTKKGSPEDASWTQYCWLTAPDSNLVPSGENLRS